MYPKVKIWACCLVILLFHSAVPRAEAAAVACTTPLAGFGPIDPANGFPKYYQDSTTLALAPCLDAVCGGPAFLGTLPNPALPVSFPGNFPAEFFYSRAIAKMTAGTVSALYTAAVEGTFLNGVVAAGNQMVFSRVRVRVAGLQPGGLYTVTHPYGVNTFTADGFGVINNTVTIGAVPLQFPLALAGPVGPFLRFATGLVPPPPGTIGNPAAPQTVTGSPCGQNFFGVAGPGLPAGGIQTNQFSTIIGKIAPVCGNGVVDLGEQCDDGAANGTLASCCSAICQFDLAGSPCSNPNPCLNGACNAAGVCVGTPNMAVCNDGNACTTADVCTAGVCVGGPPLNCNDGNLCTTDTCDPATGCVHTPNSLPCDDGNPCTTGDTCAGGACVGTPIPVCPCTPTTCAAQGKNCGTILDGCGGTLTCGACTAPQTCGGGGIANVCGPTLSLTATGRAGQTILSTPAGLSVPVGTTGSASFAPGTRITLGVTNGRAAIWAGVCSSAGNKTPTCTFTLNATSSETANVQ
jgi:hypothetical protein